MMLTLQEIYLILDLLSEKYGRGYADKPEVAKLQAKLSMMGQVVAAAREHDSE